MLHCQTPACRGQLLPIAAPDTSAWHLPPDVLPLECLLCATEYQLHRTPLQLVRLTPELATTAEAREADLGRLVAQKLATIVAQRQPSLPLIGASSLRTGAAS